MAKTMGLLLAVGAVAGYFYLNQDEEDSDNGDNSSENTPEEDEMTVATKVEKIETYTFKEYYQNVPPPSLNPLTKRASG